RWPAERFACVADAGTGAGARVALVGGADDAPLSAAVAGAMRAREKPLDLAGGLSLGGLAGLLERCSLFLGNDSGPLHFARAAGAPTVGIYWCGNLITAGASTRTLHRPVLSFRLDCPVCGVDCTRGQCEHYESFVAEVPVGEVQGHVLDLLRLTAPRTMASQASVVAGRQ